MAWLFLLGLAWAHEVTLKDCLDGAPEPVDARRRAEACPKLTAGVRCDHENRQSRAEAIFYAVAQGGALKVDVRDLVAAELICARQP